MRKSLLILAAVGLSAAATPAFAADGTVNIDGSVAAKCLFTTSSATLSLGELAGADGKLDVSTVNTKNATLVGWCNGSAATMQVNALALTNSGTPGSSFDNTIDYTATAVANSVSASDTTAAGAGTAQTVGLFSGDVVVTLSGSSTPGGKLLLSGAYTGSVVVTLSPTA
jgi:hypothetical protein